jgi:hypothetical protein
MAFEEWAATMCIARENGILAVQMGHNSKLDRGVRSFTPKESISANPSISKQFNRLFLPKTLPTGRLAHWSEKPTRQLDPGRALTTWSCH